MHHPKTSALILSQERFFALLIAGLATIAIVNSSGDIATDTVTSVVAKSTMATAPITNPTPRPRLETYFPPMRLSSPHVRVASLPASFNPALPSLQRRAPYESIILAAAEKHSVDPDLIRAVITAESAFKVKATSHAGAGGLMQLMPATGRQYGARNIYDPVQNIEAGTKYLRFLLDKFDNIAPLAIAAYNAGEGAVMKYNYTIPRYKETMQYVPKVLTYYRLYKQDAA